MEELNNNICASGKEGTLNVWLARLLSLSFVIMGDLATCCKHADSYSPVTFVLLCYRVKVVKVRFLLRSSCLSQHCLE